MDIVLGSGRCVLCQKVKGDWTGPSIGISESFETDFVERLLV